MPTNVHDVDGQVPHGNPAQADLSFGSHSLEELLDRHVDIPKDELRWLARREEARRDPLSKLDDCVVRHDR